MLKIVHELNQCDFGGVEKVIRNLIAFDKKNEHVIISYKDGPYRKHLEEAGAKVVILNQDNPEQTELDMDADIIHVHCGGAISNLAHDLGGRFPIVETIHSPVRSPNPSRIITQRVGVSDVVSRMNDKAITIRNGLDYDSLDTPFDKKTILERMNINPNIPVIGRLGRLGKDKGLEDWILTCYYLQKEGIQFTPIIIGSEARDCEGYRGALKLMCESLPLNNVIWLCNQTDISAYLQIMDVFLYPSPTEGFGLVFIEAIYNDAVVVAYDTDVTREIIGGYSILVPEKKGIPGLVEGVKKALNQSVKDNVQSLASDFVIAEYNAENMCQQYQELYERCNYDFNRPDKSETKHVVPA